MREGLALRREGDWTVVADRRARPDGSGGSGRGLWRFVRGRGRRAERIFEIPPLAAAADETTDAPMGGALCAWMAWLEATRSGQSPSLEWDRDLVDSDSGSDDRASWLRPAQLVARAGEHVVRGGLVSRPGRLTVAFPRVVELRPDLSAARRAWVREICRAAQDHWRLVRLAIDERERAVHAEVDLSGAPPPFARPLVELSAASLGCAVAWALPGLRVAIDEDVESEVMSRAPRRVNRTQTQNAQPGEEREGGRNRNLERRTAALRGVERDRHAGE